MNGSSARMSTPAKARRTGKPSPSYADGAVVRASTGRSAATARSGSWTRGSTRVSLTVTAGMMSSSGEALRTPGPVRAGQDPHARQLYLNSQHSRRGPATPHAEPGLKWQAGLEVGEGR